MSVAVVGALSLLVAAGSGESRITEALSVGEGAVAVALRTGHSGGGLDVESGRGQSVGLSGNMMGGGLESVSVNLGLHLEE